jgi:site-specific DNA-methyltransferase (adenine-specific)
MSKNIDPFLGTGSVFINYLSEYCYGFDTSPLAIEISLSKLIKLTKEDYATAMNIINSIDCELFVNYEFPDWKPFPKYALQEKYNIIKNIIHCFDNENENLRRFVKYVVISNLDKIFDYKRDGNGIKYRKSKISTEDTFTYISELLRKSIKLKEIFDKENYKKIYFYKESIITTSMNITDIDLIVTSPPYANMFDYFEVYKMELWTSGLISSYKEWKNFKKTALRSNKNTQLNKDEFINNENLEKAISKMKQNNVDNTTLSMINNYFYDMKIVLEKMYKSLNKKAYMFIVVGNSFYGGIPVITDEIIAEEAKKIGFSLVDMIISRKLSTSSQQMKIIRDEDKIYLRESIVVLRKD